MHARATKPAVTVAAYIDQQLALSEKSQKAIAAAIGYTNPNVLTMIKHGNTKLPLNKVGLLARELGVDPKHLLQLTLREYMPDLWDVLESILGEGALVSQEELAVVNFVREAVGTTAIDMADPENKREFTEALKSLTKRSQAKANATVKRISSLPPNARRPA